MNEQTNENTIPDRQTECFTADAPNRASIKALFGEALGAELRPLPLLQDVLQGLADELRMMSDALENGTDQESVCRSLERMQRRAAVALEASYRLERGSLEPHDD